MQPSEHNPYLPPAPLVEVLDSAHRVLALLPLGEVVRQKLCHRTVAVLLFDDQGRLYLRRRDSGASARRGLWDAPARGPVLAGEALQDAATRILKEELGIHAERLRRVLTLPAQPENSNEHLHLFSLTRPEPPTGRTFDPEAGDYCFLPEELDCLLRDFRELVSPRFLLLAEALSVNGLWRRP